MSGIELLIASAVVALGAVVQGTIGFGVGLVGTPLLLLIEPRLVPGPLLCAAGVLTVLLTHREWQGIEFPDLKWALSGYAVGIVAAAGLLVALSTKQLAITFGALVLLGVLLTAAGFRLRPSPRLLVGAGVLSGIMGTTASIGGPPIALVYQHASGARIRGTLSAYFVIGIVMSITGLSLIGRFGSQELLLAVGLLPGVLTGFVISHWTSGILDRHYLRTGVLLLSATAGVIVILKHAL